MGGIRGATSLGKLMNPAIEEFVQFEQDGQELLDLFYAGLGWSVNRGSACREYDVLLSKGELTYKIEEKIRRHDYGDLLLEIIQDVPSGNPGWFAETRCDYLVYAVVEGNGLKRVVFCNWPGVKGWCVSSYLPKSKRHECSSKGYGLTLNIPIRFSEIPDHLYKVYDVEPSQ